MDLLEEELTCPVCCCLFEDPRVLPCSHSFCRKCLEGILDGNRSPVWRPPFKCPTCRKETTHNGVASLQVNYSLRSIVEKYNKIRTSPKMAQCRAHSEQPLNIFCATDLKLICGFCATTGEHKGHTFCALEEAHEREKLAFEELICAVESWRSAEVLSCLEALEGARRAALSRVSRDVERVSDYFDKLFRALEHKRGEILSDFESLKLGVLQTFDPEINRLRAALEEQQRALRGAEAFRSLSEPLLFLQNMQDFREKVRVLRETTLPGSTELDVGALVPCFDVHEWDRVRLGDVDSLRAPHDSAALRLPGARLAPPPSSRVLGAGLVLLFLALVVGAVQLAAQDSLFPGLTAKWERALSGVSVRGMAACWRDALERVALLCELCGNCVTEFIETTSEFIS